MFRDRVEAERKLQGLSQEKLAKRLDWPQQKVQKVLAGNQQVRLDEAEQLARALDVPLAKLTARPPAEEDRRAAQHFIAVATEGAEIQRQITEMREQLAVLEAARAENVAQLLRIKTEYELTIDLHPSRETDRDLDN